MYRLQLSAEQLEIRDTLLDFVAREITPVTRHPDRPSVKTAAFPANFSSKRQSSACALCAYRKPPAGRAPIR